MVLFNVDEAAFAAGAVRTLETGAPILAQIRDNKPPGIFLPYVAAFAAQGPYAMGSVRVLALMIVLATSAILFAAGSAGGNRTVGAVAAGAYLLLTSLSPDFLALKTELLANLPLAAAAWLAIAALARGSAWRAGWSGAAVAAAFLCRQPAALAAVALGAGIAASGWARFGRARGAALAAAFGLGGLLLLGAVIAWYAARGALADFLLQTVWLALDLGRVSVVSPARRLIRAVTYAEEYAGMAQFTGFLALAGLGLLAFSRQARAAVSPHAGGAFAAVAVFLAVGCHAAFVSAPDIFSSYPVMLFVPFSLALGAAAAMLFAPVPWRAAPAAHRAVLAACCALAVAAGAVRALKEPVKHWLEGSRPEADALVDAMAAARRPGDALFVWGYDPTLYLLAGLRPATRFTVPLSVIGADGATGRAGGGQPGRLYLEPGAWDVLMDELARERPRFIVDTGLMTYKVRAPLAAYPRLADFVAGGYEAVASRARDGATLYRRRADQ